jgi:hypothetical protein
MKINLWVGRGSTWLVAAAAGLLLAACSESRQQAASGTRLFAADMTGAARSCDATKPQITDGGTAEAQIKMGNDGGWCAITVARGGKPFDSSLVTARPTHGKVLVHKVGDTTRIDYTPDRGYTGTDSFGVRLIPGDPTLRVAVTVQ